VEVIFNLTRDVEGIAMLSEDIGGERWVYIIDQIKTSTQLETEPRRIVMNNILDGMKQWLGERRLHVYDLLSNVKEQPLPFRDIFLNRYGIAVLRIRPGPILLPRAERRIEKVSA
jgi:hypothetical protein